MEIKNFKSVAFGGFDKEDVINYIQKTAQESADAQEALQKENESLKDSTIRMQEETERLKTRIEELTEERDRLQSQVERESFAREELEKKRTDGEQLAAQLEALRPQAEAYQKIKDQVGDIECQARKRANELEVSTLGKLDELVSAIRKQYQELAGTFNVTADHVTNELRKVEVNLSQLPRALDQAGTELKQLEEALRTAGKE